MNKILEVQILTFALLIYSFIGCNESKSRSLEDLFLYSRSTQNILNINYENAFLNSGVNDIDYVTNQDIVKITSEDANSGNFSIKTMVGTSSNYISYGKPRAESSTIRLKESLYSEDEIWEYKFSVMLSKKWFLDKSSGTEIIWQFKRFNSPPDAFIAVKGDRIVFRYSDKQIVLFETIRPSIWMNFVIYINWSSTNFGAIEIKYKFKDENLKFIELEGANMRNNKSKSGYLKWGLYRPDCLKENYHPCSEIQAEERTIFHDDISARKLSN